MPLVPSAVEHTSIGPCSGACDYTVPASIMWQLLAQLVYGITLLGSIVTLRPWFTHDLDRTLDRQFFWNAQEIFFFLEYTVT